MPGPWPHSGPVTTVSVEVGPGHCILQAACLLLRNHVERPAVRVCTMFFPWLDWHCGSEGEDHRGKHPSHHRIASFPSQHWALLLGRAAMQWELWSQTARPHALAPSPTHR